MHGYLYRRVPPTEIKDRVEAHRYISYIHHLQTDNWMSVDEFLEKVRMREQGDFARGLFTDDRRDEALRGLHWLTEMGYAERRET